MPNREHPARSGFEHIWVVVRFDDTRERSADEVANAVAATKAFRSRDEAEAEAARLQALNGPKGVVYVTLVARLEADPPS